jgi:DNA-binding LacI/PurR family transcriptional regulator
VVVPLFNARPCTEVLRGIQRGLAQHNLDLILYGIDDLRRKDTFLQRALQKRRVDGLLVVSMKLSNNLAAECKRRHLPLVLVDSRHQYFDSFTVKAQDRALLTERHWIHLGYRAVERMTVLLDHPASSPQYVRLKPRVAVNRHRSE